jgi:lipid-A-disaccharide synthase-like uncharacterized protein
LPPEANDTAVAWFPLFLGLLEFAGGLTFYGRFYVQWIYSEIKKRSAMPTAFWYMSAAGALMLFTYAVLTTSPVGALGFCFNLVVYSRNLIHIWREKGTLSRGLNVAVHAVVGAVTLFAVALMAMTWFHVYEATSQADTDTVQQTWLWLAVGVVGQGLFAGRFIVQWAATEVQRKSVVPTAFWYMSIAAASLQLLSFGQRWWSGQEQERVFAIGMVATILIYARNLWFIHRGKPGEE